MYSGHLRRQHHLELIPRLNTFHDGKHKIESALVNLASLRTGISQLTEETVVEIEIRRAERLHQEHLADDFIRMVRRDADGLLFVQHFQPRRRFGSISGEKSLERGELLRRQLVFRLRGIGLGFLLGHLRLSSMPWRIECYQKKLHQEPSFGYLAWGCFRIF